MVGRWFVGLKVETTRPPGEWHCIHCVGVPRKMPCKWHRSHTTCAWPPLSGKPVLLWSISISVRILPWAKAVSGVNKAKLHTARSPVTIAQAKNRRPAQLFDCVILYPPLSTSVACAHNIAPRLHSAEDSILKLGYYFQRLDATPK
jgi:hypothetical protein